MQFRQSFMEEGGRLLVVGGQVGRAPEEGVLDGAGQRGAGPVRPGKGVCCRPDLPVGSGGQTAAVTGDPWWLCTGPSGHLALQSVLAQASHRFRIHHGLQGRPSWTPGDPGCRWVGVRPSYSVCTTHGHCP